MVCVTESRASDSHTHVRGNPRVRREYPCTLGVGTLVLCLKHPPGGVAGAGYLGPGRSEQGGKPVSYAHRERPSIFNQLSSLPEYSGPRVGSTEVVNRLGTLKCAGLSEMDALIKWGWQSYGAIIGFFILLNEG